MSLSNVTLLQSPFPNTSASTASALSSAIVAAACVGHAVKAGSIDRILLFKTTAGAAGTLTARLEGVSAGNPDGTLLSGSSLGSITPSGGSGTVQVVTLTSPYSITKGALFSSLIYFSTFSTNTSFARAIVASFETSNHQASTPGNRTNANFTADSGLNWGNGTANCIGMICPVFTDGTCAMSGTYMFSALPSFTSIPSSGANSYYGAKWACTMTCDVECIFDQGRSDNATFSIYDASNNLLGTTSATPGQAANNSNQFVFASPIRLVAGQTYRIVKRGASGTNNLLLIPSHSQAMQEDLYGTFQLTTSSDGVNWTDTASSTVGITLGVSPVTGGGLFLPRSMNGGYDA